MIVGLYARVSTKDKEQNPENQLIRLREYCKNRNWDFREYVDYASGSKMDREGLHMLMDDLMEIDGILVLRLDRFGRSLRNLLDLLDRIRKKGKFFMAIDQGLKISEKKDPMNDFMLSILGAAAEFERELISERVRDGMARARKENKKIGRPVVLEQKGIDASRLVDLRREGKSIREISQLVGIKRSTVHGILKSVSEKPTP
jgi:DNA invertase Pin-like site-specific DNA recombinase